MELQFFWPRGCLTNPFRTPSLSFEVIGKSPCLISRNNFVKKFLVCIGHRNTVFTRCDLIFPLCRGQGVWNKTRTQLPLSQILFQNLKNYGLGDVQRFCYHSWYDLMVIFHQISNSSNVYLSSSQFQMATSLINFYQLPSASKSRIPPKNVWLFQSFIPISLLHQYQCFCCRQISFETWCIKKTDFTRQVKTRTLSQINKTQCVNGCWLIVPI
jgi:hypothetical protein